MEINEELVLRMKNEGLKVVDSKGTVFSIFKDDDDDYPYWCIDYHTKSGGWSLGISKRWTPNTTKKMIEIIKEYFK